MRSDPQRAKVALEFIKFPQISQDVLERFYNRPAVGKARMLLKKSAACQLRATIESSGLIF
jgi:hypothetical protein